MRDKKWIWASFGIFLAVLAFICVGSVSYQKTGMGISFPFFAAGGAAELRNRQEVDIDGIESIEIDYSSPDIILYKGEEGKIVIEEYLKSDRERSFCKITTEEKLFRCEQGERYFTIFSLPSSGEKIHVYLPESYIGDLKLETSSGNIQSKEEWKLSEFDVSASSGNIEFTHMNAKQIDAGTSSGNIRFENAEGSRKMKASSGNIQIESGQGSGEFITSSGNIRVTGINGETEAKASSGEIELEVIKLENDLEAEASSGNVELVLPAESEFSFYGKCGSGKVRTSFDDSLDINEKRNEAEGIYGKSPRAKVNARTSSGNVSVDIR